MTFITRYVHLNTKSYGANEGRQFINYRQNEDAILEYLQYIVPSIVVESVLRRNNANSIKPDIFSTVN